MKLIETIRMVAACWCPRPTLLRKVFCRWSWRCPSSPARRGWRSSSARPSRSPWGWAAASCCRTACWRFSSPRTRAARPPTRWGSCWSRTCCRGWSPGPRRVCRRSRCRSPRWTSRSCPDFSQTSPWSKQECPLPFAFYNMLNQFILVSHSHSKASTDYMIYLSK